MNQFYPLAVKKIEHTTPNAVVITFDIPQELKSTFKFIPGQYLTIEKELNGETLRRSYSICSDPTSREISIAVKRMDEGTFSKFANEILKEGDVLTVHPPQGRFTYQSRNTGDIITAFAAGSGITPIMSILKTVIYKTNNPFVLVYGNKSKAETMFYDELVDLAKKFSNRLTIHFIFSRYPEPGTQSGRIESTTVAALLTEQEDLSNFESFYICGPETMITHVSDTLKINGISKEHIHFELFTSEPLAENAIEVTEGSCKITVMVDDEETTFVMNKKQTILQAALANNIDAPYSCQGGICSSCVARIKEGKAAMERNQILTDEEIEEGLILTCQAHPVSDTVSIDYDDV